MEKRRQSANQDQEAKILRKPRDAKSVAPEAPVHEQTPDPALLRRAVENPKEATPREILTLQNRYGNRVVSRLIQTKLTVGAANDHYEQEANRVADQVVGATEQRGQSPVNSRQSTVQRQGEEEEIQTKRSPDTPGGLSVSSYLAPLLQRQGEEEEIQTKPLIQRQGEEEEIQTKPSPDVHGGLTLAASITPLLQRQGEEEEIQTKPSPDVHGGLT